MYIESDSALCRYRSIDDRGADATDKAPHTHKIEIVEQGLLVEPGSFVLDIQKQGHISKTGALGFINSFVNNALPGMKHPINGVVDVLELIYNTHPKTLYGLSLAVSHDTILAAMIAVMSGIRKSVVKTGRNDGRSVCLV